MTAQQEMAITIGQYGLTIKYLLDLLVEKGVITEEEEKQVENKACMEMIKAVREK